MKLRTPLPDPDHCAATGCPDQSDIIIATGPDDYGLCDRHWVRRCEDRSGFVGDNEQGFTGHGT